MEISLKAARTHNQVSQEETNSCSDLLYQFGYSRYSITQLKEKNEREESGYKYIAISSWCLWFLNWVMPYSQATMRPSKAKIPSATIFLRRHSEWNETFLINNSFYETIIFFLLYNTWVFLPTSYFLVFINLEIRNMSWFERRRRYLTSKSKQHISISVNEVILLFLHSALFFLSLDTELWN